MPGLSEVTENREPVDAGGVSGEQLETFVDRIERLEEEKSELAQDIRDIFLEAKGNGFDPKIMKQILRLRKKKPHELDEEETLLHLYKQALGMMPSKVQ